MLLKLYRMYREDNVRAKDYLGKAQFIQNESKGILDKVHLIENDIKRLDQELELQRAHELTRMNEAEFKNETKKASIRVDELNKKISAYLKSQKKLKKDFDLNVEKVNDILAIQYRRLGELELIGSVLGIFIAFSASIYFSFTQPEIGWKVNTTYYTTVATIIPIFFIAAYIETGEFKKNYYHKFSKIGDIIQQWLPIYIAEILCLIAIAFNRTTTFLFVSTFSLFSVSMFNLLSVVYLYKPLQNLGDSASKIKN